jgi:hypothetical protein
MSSQIVYAIQTVASGGQAPATVANNMGQPSPGTASPGTFRDEQFLAFWGLRASTDAVAAAGAATRRTITLLMDAGTVATGTVQITASGMQGQVKGITVSVQGIDYIRPPTPVISDATGKGARASAGLQLLSTSQVVVGDANYLVATTTAVAVGGLAAGGVPASLTPVLAGGTVTGVTVNNPTTNGPYDYPPTIVIVDSANPTDRTAVWKARMGVHPTVHIITPGDNYTAPTVVFAPFFKQMCPDSAPVAQANAVRGWMQGILSQALSMPFGELVPVVS